MTQAQVLDSLAEKNYTIGSGEGITDESWWIIRVCVERFPLSPQFNICGLTVMSTITDCNHLESNEYHNKSELGSHTIHAIVPC